MSKFLVDKYQSIEPYTPGEQPKKGSLIKLNTNESPFPPSPRAVAAAAEAARDLNLYSDPECTKLVAAIAEYYGVSTKNVIATNGSDETLAFCFQAFCDGATPAAYPDITYGFYKVFAKLYSVESKVIPLKADFSVDPQDYMGIGSTVFLANPNAPTGMALSLEDIEKIALSNPDNVVIIDEAYVDFGGVSAVELTRKLPNLLVVQTFSKSRSLAGGRIGFAIGSEELIDDLRKIKYSFNPYNVGALPQAAAAAAIADKEYFERNTAEIIAVREYTVEQLQTMGIAVLPSCANFIFVSPTRLSGGEYFAALREKGVLVRHFTAPRVCDFVRVTIGSREQMDAYLKATREILEERA